MNQDVLFYAANTLANLLTEYDGHALFLVRGNRSYFSSGSHEWLSPVLTAHHISIHEFFDFSVNPNKQDVDRGVEAIQQCSPSVIMAIGGGSALDMAKLIRYYAGKTNIPLIAIPTTAGTGAESTQFAVCYIDGVKHSISDATILPNKVILNPSLTLKNGKYLTACTGFDALAQAIEAYWNVNATSESDKLVMEAIRSLYVPLQQVVAGAIDNYENRESLMLGANLAGQAINITRTTVPHALSYTLTSKYGYPHGHAVALTFPFWFDYNVNASVSELLLTDIDMYRSKMNALLDLLGFSRQSLCQQMKNYIERLGLGYDACRPFEESVVASGINLERAKNNPTRLTPELIMESVKSIKN